MSDHSHPGTGSPLPETVSLLRRVRLTAARLTSVPAILSTAWVGLWLLAVLAYLKGPGRLPFAKVANGQLGLGVAIEVVQALLVVLVVSAAFLLTWRGLQALARASAPPPPAAAETSVPAPSGAKGKRAPKTGTAAEADDEPKVRFPAPPTVAVGVWLVVIAVLLALGLIQAIAAVFPIAEELGAVACVTEGSCEDLRNILVAMLASGVGAVITTTLGFLEHASEKGDFRRSYVPWYVARPVMGLLLGAVFYMVLKGGLLATVGSQSASSIDVYGLAGIAALVGMFSKRAVAKLREVFETLFTTKPASETKPNGSEEAKKPERRNDTAQAQAGEQSGEADKQKESGEHDDAGDP